MAAIWNPERDEWTFTLWSSVATAVRVELVRRSEPTVAVQIVELTGDDSLWSATITDTFVADAGADVYGFRVEGPYDPAQGHRCDPSKLLLDPDATHVWFPAEHDRELAKVVGTETRGRSPMAVLRRTELSPVTAPGPRHRGEDLVIYETHVRGATMRHPEVPETLRGTFAGLGHLARYIAGLGATAVELLPIHQFDPAEGNYWGYMALAWGALHHGYVSGDDPELEFSEMITSFHDVGVEVLLDVVYNHTCEEDEIGPTYSLRAIDNAAYYVVDLGGAYRNDAGCGNVVRAAHPAASKMILDSLRRYADLGIDGFRFDLGSLLGRDINGNVQSNSDLIDEITQFATERNVRLIVEPWDLAAYQVGDSFPGRTWAQWNGKFRDDVRSFLRGEDGFAGAVAQRIAGSPDLYGEQVQRSINFVTAHDGFTLNDWVSYDRKHNEANGWNNNDGTDDNRSWNCGWEGDDVPAEIAVRVAALRQQQMRNALCLMMLSRGTPMMLAGDEFGQTQGGNNNGYNQDNETTWLNWSRAAQTADLAQFVRGLTEIRHRATGGDFDFFGVGREPDFGDRSHSLAWCWGDVYVMVNAWWEPLTFTVQSAGEWVVALSSAAETPTLNDSRVLLAPRTTVVLIR